MMPDLSILHACCERLKCWMRPSGDNSSSLTPGRLREALETLGAQLARDGTVAHL